METRKGSQDRVLTSAEDLRSGVGRLNGHTYRCRVVFSEACEVQKHKHELERETRRVIRTCSSLRFGSCFDWR